MNYDLRIAINNFNSFVGEIDLELFKNLGELTNLKLHQVNHMFYNMEGFESFFNDFCIDEYRDFEEHLRNHNLIKTHIGNTSAFYIEHEHFNLFDSFIQYDYEKASCLDKLELLIINEINHWYDINDIELFALSIIDVNEENIKADDIDFLRLELQGTIELLKDINETYKYIEDFKERQCEYFLEYVDMINSMEN